MATFWPSTKPSARSPCRNDSIRGDAGGASPGHSRPIVALLPLLLRACRKRPRRQVLGADLKCSEGAGTLSGLIHFTDTRTRRVLLYRRGHDPSRVGWSHETARVYHVIRRRGGRLAGTRDFTAKRPFTPDRSADGDLRRRCGGAPPSHSLPKIAP